MANYRTQLSEGYGPRVGSGWHRGVFAGICGQIAMTTAMLDNADDEVELGWAPAGFIVTGIELRATDMDTNGTPTLVIDIGDAGDEDRLIAASTIAQAGGRTNALEATGLLYKFTAATRIKAFIKTAAATAAAGTLSYIIWGFIDPEFAAANAVIGTA